MLKIENLYVNYDAIEALRGISFNIQAGEVVCLLGANGAGKSTTLRTISGLLKPRAGRIVFNEFDITGMSTQKIVKLGISQIPEGRQVFPDLTVMEHLELGAYHYHSNRSRRGDYKRSLEQVFELFPELTDKRNRPACTLSGGQQQMVVIGRALMSQPKLLLLDEPTMGLAPILVQKILDTVRGMPGRGISALLVEQNAHAALQIADRGYVLVDGRIALEGKGKELLGNKELWALYLGGKIADKQNPQ